MLCEVKQGINIKFSWTYYATLMWANPASRAATGFPCVLILFLRFLIRICSVAYPKWFKTSTHLSCNIVKIFNSKEICHLCVISRWDRDLFSTSRHWLWKRSKKKHIQRLSFVRNSLVCKERKIEEYCGNDYHYKVNEMICMYWMSNLCHF